MFFGRKIGDDAVKEQCGFVEKPLRRFHALYDDASRHRVKLSVFLGVWLDFFIRVRRHGADSSSPERTAVRSRAVFKAFLAALLLATVAILARSIFRAAELWEGFEGKLWNSEIDFLVLDGAMVALAVLALSALHPGLAFGGQWNAANWSLRTGKEKTLTAATTREGKRSEASSEVMSAYRE